MRMSMRRIWILWRRIYGLESSWVRWWKNPYTWSGLFLCQKMLKSMLQESKSLFILLKLFLNTTLWRISMLMPQLLKQKIILLVHLLPLAISTFCNLPLISKEAKMGINFHFFHQNTSLLLIFQSALMDLFSSLFIQPHALIPNFIKSGVSSQLGIRWLREEPWNWCLYYTRWLDSKFQAQFATMLRR